MRSLITAAAAWGILSWTVTPAAAQGPAAKAEAPDSARNIARTEDGRSDFSGYYNIPYTPNMAQGKEPEVPYTERGRQAYVNHDSKDDPTANCWFPGVPRIMQSPYPAQIVQTRDYLVILFEYMTMFRSIPLNNRRHAANMEPSFMGDSVGHWEGDSLIVDTIGLKDAPWTWLDTAGHQHSDALPRWSRLSQHLNASSKINAPGKNDKYDIPLHLLSANPRRICLCLRNPS